MEIQVLYENENYIVINKPAGLVVHNDGKTDEPTLVDWILEKYPEVEGVGEDQTTMGAGGQVVTLHRPGIVHRLDRDTSGVMVIARTQDAFDFLKQAFKDRVIHKIYRALVYGNITSDEGVIDAAIGRSNKNFRQWSAQRGARGQMRDAVTEYTVLKRFVDGDEKYCEVEFRPKTGRTHQIRVHAKYLGNPIVSDALYAGKRKSALGFKTQALHAYQISFVDMNGEEVVYEAPLPENFTMF